METKDLSLTIVRVIIGGSFIGGGCFILYKFLMFYKKAKESLKWEKTKGRIIKSEYVSTFNGDVPSLEFQMLYKFNIGETEYKGDNLFFRTFDGDNKNYQKRYPINKEVDVYFNPKNPKESVLLPGIEYNLYYLIPLGLIVLIIGILVLPI